MVRPCVGVIRNEGKLDPSAIRFIKDIKEPKYTKLHTGELREQINKTELSSPTKQPGKNKT